MRRFFISIFTILCMFLGGFSVRAADPVINDQYPFAIQTTQMSAGKTFSFQVGAKGTFSVDWGDGTTQTYIVSKVGTAFTSSSITNGTTISHTYTNASSADGWNIRIGGNVTQLPAADSDVPTILFYKNTYVKTLHGSLGRLFPTTNGIAPKFNSTFYGCTNLQSLPNGLFDGITGTTSYMFASIFAGCSSLTKIPEKLFAGISGEPAKMMFYYTFSNSGVTGGIPENLFAGISGAPVDRMFSGTFYLCRGLTGSIPENLFAGISGEPADYMFNDTFYYCEGLTGSVPENLFTEFDAYGNYVRGIRGVPAEGMFRNTFRGAAGLTNIPEKLFAGISGAPAAYMFNGTFQSCVGLKGAIPENLFSGIVGAPKAGMFGKTFYDCRQLTSIPQNLFGGISGAPAEGMFEYTFWNDLKLTGYVPRTMFGNITGLGTSSVVGLDYTFSSVPNMSTTCPAGMVTLIRPSSWASVAFCDVCPDGKIAPAGATSIDQCVQPSVICSLGTYLSADLTTCTQCPSAYPNSDAGATAITQCYSNTKYRSWTGVKQACSVANASATCNDCVGVSCNYVAYSNAAGNGDGALKSGCATNNASCNQSVASFTCNAGYYKNGSVCTQCPVARPMSPVGATSESQCFAPSVTCAPGNYLPANSTTCTKCVAGSYCIGGTFNPKNAPQGINSCGTGMTSDAGAKNSSECYKLSDAFTITTTYMPANAAFSFKIGAAGNFTVDWGDGSAPTVVSRNAPAYEGNISDTAAISHKYTTAGVHTITITGRATAYADNAWAVSAFLAQNNAYIAELGGSLGAVFPTLNDTATGSPQFFVSFEGCTNLKTVSDTLFNGITRIRNNMFDATFRGCNSLTTVPQNLFSGISGAAPSAFNATFMSCDKIRNIAAPDGTLLNYVPAEMFPANTTAAENMYLATFQWGADGTGPMSDTCPAGLYLAMPKTAAEWRTGNDVYRNIVACAACPMGSEAPAGATSVDQCVAKTITCAAGTYLPANSIVCAECVAGAYCGGGDFTFNDTIDAGITSCGTNMTSNAGATSASQCRPDIIAGCEDGYPFRITTIDMPAGAYFNNFKIGAAGTFKIDWGDGSDPEIIQRDNPAVNDLFLGSVDEISHQYTTGGVHTVQICGRATEYYGGDDVRPAVRFADNSNIAELHGDLGALFPVFGSSWNQKPQFFQTFARCNNLKGISENLFDGINGSTRNMFKETFMGDRSLTQIPAGLFSTINQGANGMFVGTFSACENLNTITDGQISYSYVPSSMLLVAGGTEYYQNMFTNTKLDNSCGDDAVSATQGVNNSTWRPNVDDATPVAICTPCSDGEHAVNGSCVTICVDGYTYNPDNKKCEIKCAGGSWIESAGDTQCANVGAGYYAPTHIVIYNEPDTARQQCDDGLTTIGYGRGADEATDCGKRLPLNKDGTKYLYFHPDQRTHPAFMMTSKGVPFYADAAENITGHFQMKLNNKTYGIYNQDIDAPESTEPTEPAESVGGGDRLPS